MTDGNSVRSALLSLGPSGLVNAAGWTLDRLEKIGVQIPRGNRLELARNLIRDVQEGRVVVTADDDSQLKRLTEAHWTVMDQYIIARGLNPRRAHKPAELAKLKTMLGGPETSDAERNPIARNTQFELYVGATLAMGGVSVDLQEPDLTFEYLGATTGIAAKRVRSLAQLKKRVIDGVGQIARTGRPGFVAVNADAIIKVARASGDLHAPLDRRLTALKSMDRMLASRGAVGSIVFGHDAKWDFTGPKPRIEIATFNRIRVYPADADQKASAERFFGPVLEQIETRLRSL